MALTKLLFIRHSSVKYKNIPDFDLTISLSSAGKAQSEELRDILSASIKIPVAAIYSSDLPRAIETIKPYADKINTSIVMDPRLREHNYRGDPKVFHNIVKTDPLFRHPGGEALHESCDRFIKAVNSIVADNSGGFVIISTHGTVFTEFMKAYFHKTDEFYYELSNPDLYYVIYDGSEAKYFKRLAGLLPLNTATIN